jgi:hypothetical protein
MVLVAAPCCLLLLDCYLLLAACCLLPLQLDCYLLRATSCLLPTCDLAPRRSYNILRGSVLWLADVINIVILPSEVLVMQPFAISPADVRASLTHSTFHITQLAGRSYLYCISLNSSPEDVARDARVLRCLASLALGRACAIAPICVSKAMQRNSRGRRVCVVCVPPPLPLTLA